MTNDAKNGTVDVNGTKLYYELPVLSGESCANGR